MAGTVRGKIDCLTTPAAAVDRGQEIFKSWFDHMQTLVGLSVCTRIAYQFGDAATGSDYYDGANPFLTGAWALYRFAANGGRLQDFYMLGQYGTGTTTTDGDPILINSSTQGATNGAVSFAFASALESNGTTVADPWKNATRNNDGTDLKGLVAGVGPVWGPPVGGTLAVWPISNQTGFSDGTNKENTFEFYLNSFASENARFGFINDNDNFFAYVDEGDNLGQNWFWFGPHTWATGLSPTPLYNLTLLRADENIIDGELFGDTTGVSLNQGGGFTPSELGMRGFTVQLLMQILKNATQPSNMRGGSIFEETPIYTTFQDTLSKGAGGTLDPFIKAVLGTIDQNTKTDKTRFVVGANSTSLVNITVPWDGTTTPRLNATRGGIDF